MGVDNQRVPAILVPTTVAQMDVRGTAAHVIVLLIVSRSTCVRLGFGFVDEESLRVRDIVAGLTDANVVLLYCTPIECLSLDLADTNLPVNRRRRLQHDLGPENYYCAERVYGLLLFGNPVTTT